MWTVQTSKGRRNMTDKEWHFQCIHCGCNTEKLYHDYKAGITKVTSCKACGKIADKYVEYDSAIILLDVLLLQKQAYAHLLINVEVKSHWRFAVLLWVVEAFIKLIQQRSEHAYSNKENANYSYVGVELYLNYIGAAVELMSFLLCILAVLALRSLVMSRSFKLLNMFLITKAILLSNLGSLLTMPALLWGKSCSPMFVLLGQAFVCLSSLQALRVVLVGPHKTLIAAMAVATGIYVQSILSEALNTWLYGMISPQPFSHPA